MRTFIFLTVFVLILGVVHGQELKVYMDDEELEVNRINEKRWEILLAEDTLLVFKKSELTELIEHYRLLEAVKEHRDSIIASNKRLLAAYEKYQKRADEHINVQRDIITTADSLVHGYRSLYNDLKQLVATPRVGLSGGLGIVFTKEDDWRPVGMLGVQYQRWQLQYQIGRRYHGMMLGFQLPVLF